MIVQMIPMACSCVAPPACHRIAWLSIPRRSFRRVTGMRNRGLPMAESSTISPRLAQEFFETLREYIQQAFSAPDSGMTFDRYVRMSLVCGRVESFVDPLPDDAFDALYHLAMDDEMHK